MKIEHSRWTSAEFLSHHLSLQSWFHRLLDTWAKVAQFTPAENKACLCVCLHYDGCQGESFNYTLQVCSVEPNKLECHSQTHLGARCCSSDTLINDTEAEWEHDTMMDSSHQLIQLRVWNEVHLITVWEWLTLFNVYRGALEQGTSIQNNIFEVLSDEWTVKDRDYFVSGPDKMVF